MAATGESRGTIGVLGGGCFGTAFAHVMGCIGYEVNVWARNPATVNSINTLHENAAYLKGLQLSPNVSATVDLPAAVTGASLVAVAIPTPFLRETVVRHRDVLPTQVPIVLLSKGIENNTLLTPCAILREELPGKYGKFICAVLGPSFAQELAKGLPANVTCASESREVGLQVQQMLSDRLFRVVTTDDIVGVEHCGAMKNIIAIATGLSDGLEMGCNWRAALITRGLAEISKVAVAKGGKPTTMLSLAGVGDLLMTCTASQSRNYSVGFRLAKGETMEQIRRSMKEVAEGVTTAVSVHHLAHSLGIDAPICEAVYDVISNGKSVEHAMSDLLDRDPGVETRQLHINP
eukprot:GGOE01037465.1.p1 GENE.GGOE01037465.1~~GGOE01037465.1.p1  ORF type:complete len:381 (-),score=99.57 GGOE01037465.1:255-1298(-)